MHVYAAEEFFPTGKSYVCIFASEAQARDFCSDAAICGNRAVWWDMCSTAQGSNGY